MATEGSGKFADIQSLRQHVIRQCDVPGYTQINPPDQRKIDRFKITRNDETISVQNKNHSAKTNIEESCKFTEFLDLDQCSHRSGGWLFPQADSASPPSPTSAPNTPSNLPARNYQAW